MLTGEGPARLAANRVRLQRFLATLSWGSAEPLDVPLAVGSFRDALTSAISFCRSGSTAITLSHTNAAVAATSSGRFGGVIAMAAASEEYTDLRGLLPDSALCALMDTTAAGAAPNIKVDELDLEDIGFLAIGGPAASPSTIEGSLRTIVRCAPVLWLTLSDVEPANRSLLAAALSRLPNHRIAYAAEQPATPQRLAEAVLRPGATSVWSVPS